MATFEPLDLQQWPRREWFEHYLDRCPTYYSMTVDLDITNLRAAVDASGRKTYPTQIWALATVVNRHPEFRMALDDQGNPGVWDVVDPAFTVFNPIARPSPVSVRATHLISTLFIPRPPSC